MAGEEKDLVPKEMDLIEATKEEIRKYPEAFGGGMPAVDGVVKIYNIVVLMQAAFHEEKNRAMNDNSPTDEEENVKNDNSPTDEEENVKNDNSPTDEEEKVKKIKISDKERERAAKFDHLNATIETTKQYIAQSLREIAELSAPQFYSESKTEKDSKKAYLEAVKPLSLGEKIMLLIDRLIEAVNSIIKSPDSKKVKGEKEVEGEKKPVEAVINSIKSPDSKKVEGEKVEGEKGVEGEKKQEWRFGRYPVKEAVSSLVKAVDETKKTVEKTNDPNPTEEKENFVSGPKL